MQNIVIFIYIKHYVRDRWIPTDMAPSHTWHMRLYVRSSGCLSKTLNRELISLSFPVSGSSYFPTSLVAWCHEKSGVVTGKCSRACPCQRILYSLLSTKTYKQEREGNVVPSQPAEEGTHRGNESHLPTRRLLFTSTLYSERPLQSTTLLHRQEDRAVRITVPTSCMCDENFAH